MKFPVMNITIRNEAESGEAVIDIDGAIGFDIMKWLEGEEQQNTKEAVKEKLKEISGLQASRITVNINSLGGDVNDGISIHDLLAQHDAEIVTNINGMTASAATVIAQAGGTRRMSANALYLIHNSWTFAMGNRNEMLKMAEELEQIDGIMANIYARRGGKDRAYFLDLMNEDEGAGIWLTADEAKEHGLIDEVFEPMAMAASADPRLLKALGMPVPSKGSRPEKEERSNNAASATEARDRAIIDTEIFIQTHEVD